MRTQWSCLLPAAALLAGLFAACAVPAPARDEIPPAAAVREAPVGETALVRTALPAAEAHAQPHRPVLENLTDTINTLCATPRPMGSEAEYRAAVYLRDRMADYGYQCELQPFAYNLSRSTLSERYQQVRGLTGDAFFAGAFPGTAKEGDSQNVIARQPGEDEKGKILILSAHYDSTADSLGVVDNAAGVATVLEAARILAEEDLPFALRVVLFGGEEQILIGSRQYVWALSPAERERILANISVDTLAYSSKEAFVVLTPLSVSPADAPTLASASPAAAAFLADARVTPEFYSRFVGDHMAFAAAGIDSLNFGQTMNGVDGVINSPADNYDLLEPHMLPVAAQMLVEAVRELAKQV